MALDRDRAEAGDEVPAQYRGRKIALWNRHGKIGQVEAATRSRPIVTRAAGSVPPPFSVQATKVAAMPNDDGARSSDTPPVTRTAAARVT